MRFDPTLGIHERLLLSRDGQVPTGAVDYLSHMPVGYRRDAMKAPADMSAPGDDQAYRGAFEEILETVRMLHDRGVFIVFGTDTGGGSFTYHRELELYERAGMTLPRSSNALPSIPPNISGRIRGWVQSKRANWRTSFSSSGIRRKI